MLRRSLLYSCLTLMTLCSHNVAMAQDTHASDKYLKGRDEVKTKLGSDRSIVSNELWAPLWQSQDGVGTDAVIYSDLRLMGDDQDNREFNLGVGYRTLLPGESLILGGHAWFDRRKTEMGSTFNQITLGGEVLSDAWDFRGNVYVPLSDKESYLTGFVAPVNPYLAGTGIYYNTGGNTYLVEEPQPGFDLEIGTRLPFADGFTDQTRAYAGMYHFEGDASQSVTGWRTRIASDVTQDVQLGARVQQDDIRGMQGFLEATIRFPFGNKKSYKDHGLRSRLDESPERDVDIVTGSAKIAPQLAAAINRDTGTVQRIIHVDNTAANGGDGSLEHPYNTLADAQTVIREYDVIYLHEGDGTTAGQDLGIRIDKEHASLIGSGAAFTFDNDRFVAGSSSSAFNGFVLRAAGTAPMITNISAASVVSVRASNVLVSGVHAVSGTSSSINVGSDTLNSTIRNVLIENNTVSNPTNAGIYVLADASNVVSDVTIRNNLVENTTSQGIRVQAYGGTVNNILVADNTVTNSPLNGYLVVTRDGGSMSNVTLENNLAQTSGNDGFRIWGQSAADTFSNILLTNNISENNSQSGIRNHIVNGTVNSMTISNNILRNNGSSGIHLYGDNNSMQSVSITGNTVENQTLYGLNIANFGTSSLNLFAENNVIRANARDGIYVNKDSTGAVTADFGGGGLGSTGRNSIFGNGTSGGAFRDVILDLNGSLTPLPMQYNWWGQAGGPAGGRIRTETGGVPPAANTGSADTSNALPTAP